MSDTQTAHMPKNFKALRLSEGHIEFYTATPHTSAGPQLTIKTRLAGICRSDIKELAGTRTVRHDFGHEILGRVVGSNDPRLPALGQWVVLDPHINIQRNSGFSEFVIAEADIDALIKAFVVVPQSIPEEKLIFTEPLACAHHCISNILRFEEREHLKGLSVAVVGAGMTGTLIGMLCRHYGADVTMVNRGRERLDFLRSKGVFDEKQLALSSEIEREFDIVIPTTTFLFEETLQLCEKLIKEKGLVQLYGGTKAGDLFPSLDIDIDDVRRNQKVRQATTAAKTFRIGGTHGATSEDFKHVVSLLESYPSDLPVERLISKRIRLEDVPEALKDMLREDTSGKTIVTVDQTSDTKEGLER